MAVVGTLGIALGALITGLSGVAQQTAARKIILKSKTRTIEVPANISSEKLDDLIRKPRCLDNDIEVVELC